MISPDQIDAYVQLSREKKNAFLLRLAHELTIVGRDTYEVGGNGLLNPIRFRTINEIQHRILASCLALTENNSKRYPDEVLLQIILEHQEDTELEQQVKSAYERVLAKFIPAARAG